MMKQLGSVVAVGLLTACSMAGGGHATTSGSTVARQSANTESLTVSKDTVKHIQSALQSKGFYKGPIDGVVGPDTRRGLAEYQQGEGLQRTAVLDEKTLQSLLSMNTAANPTPPAGGSGSSAPS